MSGQLFNAFPIRSIVNPSRTRNECPTGRRRWGNERGGRFMDHPILASIRLPTQDSRGWGITDLRPASIYEMRDDSYKAQVDKVGRRRLHGACRLRKINAEIRLSWRRFTDFKGLSGLVEDKWRTRNSTFLQEYVCIYSSRSCCRMKRKHVGDIMQWTGQPNRFSTSIDESF